MMQTCSRWHTVAPPLAQGRTRHRSIAYSSSLDRHRHHQRRNITSREIGVHRQDGLMKRSVVARAVVDVDEDSFDSEVLQVLCVCVGVKPRECFSCLPWSVCFLGFKSILYITANVVLMHTHAVFASCAGRLLGHLVWAL